MKNIQDILDNIELPTNQPMKTGKASGWGGFYSYHWVQLPVTEVNDGIDNITPAVKWCSEYFGRSGTRWFEKGKKFYFKDEKDLSLFILQFCS